MSNGLSTAVFGVLWISELIARALGRAHSGTHLGDDSSSMLPNFHLWLSYIRLNNVIRSH